MAPGLAGRSARASAGAAIAPVAIVAGSLLALFPEALARHLRAAPDRVPAVTPVLIAPLTIVRGEDAQLDESYATKQPDWSHDGVDSGAAPAERFADFPEIGAELE